MDEFAIQKGHRYATVIIEPRRKRVLVLWVGRGRDRACVKTFFTLLGPERCAQIRAVAMDMHTSFVFEIREHCPGAENVFDLFHVVAKYGREVIDRVRVDEAKPTHAGRSTRASSRASTTRSRSSTHGLRTAR